MSENLFAGILPKFRAALADSPRPHLWVVGHHFTADKRSIDRNHRMNAEPVFAAHTECHLGVVDGENKFWFTLYGAGPHGEVDRFEAMASEAGALLASPTWAKRLGIKSTGGPAAMWCAFLAQLGSAEKLPTGDLLLQNLHLKSVFAIESAIEKFGDGEPGENWPTSTDAALAIDMGKPEICRLVKSGAVKHVRKGRNVHVDANDVVREKRRKEDRS